MTSRVVIASLVLLTRAAWSQTSSTPYILDWSPKPQQQQGLLAGLHSRLDRLLDSVVRYTSPDIPRQSRRLWEISVDGTGKCLVTTDTGVHLPRWGKADYLLYLAEADTNGDGRIDFRDDFLIRIVPVHGGDPVTIGQGKSAAWSPDGKYVAIVKGADPTQEKSISVVDLDGRSLAAGAIPAGQLVMANSLNPEVAREFWALDLQNRAKTPLPEDLRKKYLWLGVLSPGGSKVVFSTATRRSIQVVEAGQTAGRTVLEDDAFNLDPGWSPDETHIVYVSTASGGKPCSR